MTAPARSCLRCGKDLTDETGVCIFAAGQPVPGLLCVEHGANGANGMTQADYEWLLPGADSPAGRLLALGGQYPDWQLRPAPAGYAAEHTSPDGRHIRYIAARTVEELAGKLQTAKVVEP